MAWQPSANIMNSDAEDTLYVYQWRQEQEKKLRNEKGAGMTDEQVISFVDGCTFTAQLLACILKTDHAITHV